jgi:hypothetical protein
MGKVGPRRILRRGSEEMYFCHERRSAAMTRVLLFLSFYLPLFAVLAVIGGGTSKIIAYALVVTSVLSWAGLEAYFRHARKRTHAETPNVRSWKLRDDEIVSYGVSYLLPVLAVFATPPLNLFALGFFLVIGFLFVNSNMLHINPIMSLRGHRLFDVYPFDGRSYSVLAKTRFQSVAVINALAISRDIYLKTQSDAPGVETANIGSNMSSS